MARETWVQYKVESYQRLKKWYLMPPCLTLSIIRYGSRVKWSNPGKWVAPSPTPWCSSYRKGTFGLPSTMVTNFTLLNLLVFGDRNVVGLWIEIVWMYLLARLQWLYQIYQNQKQYKSTFANRSRTIKSSAVQIIIIIIMIIYSLKVFHIRWSFTGVWVTASLL